jgi:hypothetical protein
MYSLEKIPTPRVDPGGWRAREVEKKQIPRVARQDNLFRSKMRIGIGWVTQDAGQHFGKCDARNPRGAALKRWGQRHRSEDRPLHRPGWGAAMLRPYEEKWAIPNKPKRKGKRRKAAPTGGGFGRGGGSNLDALGGGGRDYGVGSTNGGADGTWML